MMILNCLIGVVLLIDIFDNFLINIPNLDADGYWNYEVNIYPKIEQYIISLFELFFMTVRNILSFFALR